MLESGELEWLDDQASEALGQEAEQVQNQPSLDDTVRVNVAREGARPHSRACLAAPIPACSP